jgi:hypothetical protein
MHQQLAEKLLAKVMSWNPQEVAENRPILEIMASLKYDEYQQFSPGMRFIESLAIWLGQFKLAEERNLAYQYIKDNLQFVSVKEIEHLISMIYKDYVRSILINKTAKALGILPYKVLELVNSVEYKILLSKSLFLGLSDGARVDMLRRFNPEIDHEQVFPIYLIEDGKIGDLQKELILRLTKINDGKELNPDENKFKILFLFDDFTASGLSYFRVENGEQKGKLFKVIHKIADKENLGKVLDANDLEIHVILYIATVEALSRLEKEVNDWIVSSNLRIHISFYGIQKLLIEEKVKDAEFIEILKKYFDSAIVNESFKKGKHKCPYLGYDECALTVVLHHNTPNNSIPLLWYEEDQREYQGLFPRVNRHKK